jgi:hypothetical protein
VEIKVFFRRLDAGGGRQFNHQCHHPTPPHCYCSAFIKVCGAGETEAKGRDGWMREVGVKGSREWEGVLD